MPKITVYTIHCPACKVLEKKLTAAGLVYDVVDDVTQMTDIKIFPMMTVDGGDRMTYKQAVDWVKEYSNGQH